MYIYIKNGKSNHSCPHDKYNVVSLRNKTFSRTQTQRDIFGCKHHSEKTCALTDVDDDDNNDKNTHILQCGCWIKC